MTLFSKARDKGSTDMNGNPVGHRQLKKSEFADFNPSELSLTILDLINLNENANDSEQMQKRCKYLEEQGNKTRQAIIRQNVKESESEAGDRLRSRLGHAAAAFINTGNKGKGRISFSTPVSEV